MAYGEAGRRYLRLSWVRLMASSLGSLEAAARLPGMRLRMVSIQLPPLLALAATRLSASPSCRSAAAHVSRAPQMAAGALGHSLQTSRLPQHCIVSCRGM